MATKHGISRRRFIKNSAMYALAGLAPASLGLKAATPPVSSNLLVNLSLDGGPDFRHLFTPPYDSESGSYGNVFWRSRAAAHNIDNPDDAAALRSRYENDYAPVTLGGQRFAVLKQCGWLGRQIAEGNVAIVNNVVMSQNRDHSHSIIIQESAQLDASSHDGERSGWGGRLAQQANKSIISLSQNVRLFCNGEKIGDVLRHSNERVIDMSDSRKASLLEFNLATADNNTDPWRAYWDDARIKRTLKSYYTALADEIDASSPFYKVMQNERNLRRFGQGIDARLADFAIPDSLKAFYDWENKAGNLHRPGFGQQLRNLYDAILCQDILDAGIASMDYGGWDSHKRTPAWIEGKLNDLFGDEKGFDILFQELELVAPDVLNKMVILVSGEFGRQLAANGTQGTDHGTGNAMLLIGRPVRGDCYGEMFPDSELGGPDVDPKHTFAQPNSDIKGLTSMEQVYARVCDWLSPGTSEHTLPGWRNAMIENNVDLANVLNA